MTDSLDSSPSSSRPPPNPQGKIRAHPRACNLIPWTQGSLKSIYLLERRLRVIQVGENCQNSVKVDRIQTPFIAWFVYFRLSPAGRSFRAGLVEFSFVSKSFGEEKFPIIKKYLATRGKFRLVKNILQKTSAGRLKHQMSYFELYLSCWK